MSSPRIKSVELPLQLLDPLITYALAELPNGKHGVLFRFAQQADDDVHVLFTSVEYLGGFMEVIEESGARLLACDEGNAIAMFELMAEEGIIVPDDPSELGDIE